MKRLFFVVGLILAFVVGVYAEEKALSLQEVLKNLDPSTHTKAELKEYHSSIKGASVSGSGTVVNVLPPGRGIKQTRVTILTSDKAPEKGYDVVLYTTQDASSLKMGQKIKFSGTIGRFSTFKGLSVDVMGEFLE